MAVLISLVASGPPELGHCDRTRRSSPSIQGQRMIAELATRHNPAKAFDGRAGLRIAASPTRLSDGLSGALLIVPNPSP
jgi:hypothetical protein